MPTAVVAEPGAVMVAPLPGAVQIPVPIAGEAAVIVPVRAHTVWELPTTGVPGNASLVTLTLAVLSGHVPFETRH